MLTIKLQTCNLDSDSPGHLATFVKITVVLILGCVDGAMVRALASHQCGMGPIPRLGVICGLSLLVLYSAPRGFSPDTPVFPSPLKPMFDWIYVDWLLISIDSVPNYCSSARTTRHLNKVFFPFLCVSEVAPTDKASFVYRYMQTSLIGQYNGNDPLAAFSCQNYW